MTKPTWIVLGLIVAAGAWLRFSGLDRRSLWLDEALAWRLAQFPWLDLFQRDSGPYESDNPPLYPMFLRVWQACWGDTEFALRFPSALAGTLAIPAAYGFVREVCRFTPAGSRLAQPTVASRTGLFAAALLAISELQVSGSRQARMYSPGVLLLLLSSWALLRALRTRESSARWWAGYGISAIAFCYLHVLGLFSVVAQFLFAAAYLGAAFRPGGADRAAAKRQWGRLMLTGAGMAIVYLPEFLVLLGRYHGTRAVNSWMGPLAIGPATREAFDAFLSTPARAILAQTPVGRVAGLAVLVLALGPLLRQGWAGLFLAAATFVPAGLVLYYSLDQGTSLVQGRYLTFIAAMWLVGLAVGVAGLPRPVALPTLLAVGVVWALCALGPVDQIRDGRAKPGMRAAVEHVADRRRPDEPVLIQNAWTFFPVAYYLRRGPRPLIVAPIRSRHLLGQSGALEDDEVVRPDYLTAAHATSFWLISTATYGDAEGLHFPLPGRWTVLAREEFARDYPWERPVRVEYYRKQSEPGRGPETKPRP